MAPQKKTDPKSKEEPAEVPAEKIEEEKDDKKIKRLYVAVTSDRGSFINLETFDNKSSL